MILLDCGWSYSNGSVVVKNKDITDTDHNVCGADSVTDASDSNAAVG